MMSEKDASQATPSYVTEERFNRESRYQDQLIANLRNKIKLLVRILVDKKIIGEEVAKSFAETAKQEATDEVLKWYVKQEKQKQEK